MKKEANPQTEQETGKGHHNQEPTSLRELVERLLESAGASNVVELVRDVVGPEPFRGQPRIMQLFAIVFLGVPLAFLLVVEWNFRQILPAWISFPLTVIGFIFYLWKHFRRSNASDSGSRKPFPPKATAVLSHLSGDSPDALEARQLARLLVSEIKMYNSDLVAQGVREGSLYKLLQKDIERARSIYDSRIAPATRNVHDYFQEELVRILAGGNADLLKT